jgi:hypothetical protein
MEFTSTYNIDLELYRKYLVGYYPHGLDDEYKEEYDPEYDDLIFDEYEFSPLLPKGKVL